MKNSEFCVKLYYVLKNSSHIFLVLTLAAGDLDDIIYKQNYLSEASVKFLFSPIVAGLDHLRALNIIHLDLKPANILMTEDKRALISDFGLSLRKESKNDKFQYFVGTLGYSPPESGINYKDSAKYLGRGKHFIFVLASYYYYSYLQMFTKQ